MSNALLIEKRVVDSIPIEIWTINRPDKLNAINTEVIARLDEEGKRLALELEKDPMSVRALILTGAGDKAFVAGADIAELKNFKKLDAERRSIDGQEAFGRLEALPIPTIAAIRGFALGGGLEIAMCCDVLVADAASEFGQPEVYLGVLPGFGATARFLDRIGIAKGLELLYSGRRIKAVEARSLGLIQHITDVKSPLEYSVELAIEMTRRSAPLAIKAIKQIAHQIRKARFMDTLSLESRLFGEIFETLDKQEGVVAFLEKRKADFKGR